MDHIELELHFEDGRLLRQRYGLPLLIGRDASCGLVLRTWRVARQHARVHCRDKDVFIDDLGSLMGTTVNGVRVASYGPLLGNDELVIGPCLIHVIPVDSSMSSMCSGLTVPAEKITQPVFQDPIPILEGTLLDFKQNPGLALQEVVHKSNIDPDPGLDPGVEPAPTTGTINPGLQSLRNMANDDLNGSIAWQARRHRLHESLIAALQLRRRDISGMSDTALRTEAEAVLSGLIAREDNLPTALDRSVLVRELVDEAVGLGPLEPLLANPEITEIMVNRHDEIFVERAGKLVRESASFSSEQAVLGVIDRIVTPLGRRIDDSAPMVDARLRDGSRVNAVIAPIALRGASLTIRKFPTRRLEMNDLLAVGALDESMAQFLQHCVLYRKNILVSGGTGSGKTSLLNILSNAIPAGERIVTIEDAAELRLNHAHLISLEARPPNLEGRGQVDIRDLVRNSLRMRPDRIVVGECRGGEAFDMLAAMNTGHEGSLTTLHANNPRDALGRLETMILMAGMDLPLAAIREHIASSIDIIVQLARVADGRRLMNVIVQVTGIESGRIQLQELFLAQAGPPAVFTGCGLLPEGFSGPAALDVALFSQQTISQGRATLEAGFSQGARPC